MLVFSVLALLPAVLATTIPSCPVNKIQVPLIAGLEVPAGETVAYITVGRGFQNYTCTAGKYVAAGAVANLYDASCIVSLLDPYIPAGDISTALTASAIRILDYPTSTLPVKFSHYFTRTAAGGIAPVFRDSAGKEIVASVATRVDAPQDPATTIPWLRLSKTSGSLAKSVFRTHTVQGQPPSSCGTEGESLSVDYAAMYYFTK